jgi:hypothetical protein
MAANTTLTMTVGLFEVMEDDDEPEEESDRFDEKVEDMDEREFRSHFRLSTKTFKMYTKHAINCLFLPQFG